MNRFKVFQVGDNNEESGEIPTILEHNGTKYSDRNTTSLSIPDAGSDRRKFSLAVLTRYDEKDFLCGVEKQYLISNVDIYRN